MMKLLTLILLLLVSSFAYADNSSMSDEEIIQVIIYKSIATHRGNCACPYSRATNGSKFFVSARVYIEHVVLCRPSPGVFRGGIKGTNWYKGVVQSQKS